MTTTKTKTKTKTKKFDAKDDKCDANDVPSAQWQFTKKRMTAYPGFWPNPVRGGRAPGAARAVKADCKSADGDAKAKVGRAHEVVIETLAHQHEKAGLEVHYRRAKDGEGLAWWRVDEAHLERQKRGACTLVSQPMPMADITDESGEGVDIELFSSRKFVVGDYGPGATSGAGSGQDISFVEGYYATERQFTRLNCQDEDDPETEKRNWKQWLEHDIQGRKGKPMDDTEFRGHHIRLWYSAANNDEVTRVAIDGVTYYCNEPFLLKD